MTATRPRARLPAAPAGSEGTTSEKARCERMAEAEISGEDASGINGYG